MLIHLKTVVRGFLSCFPYLVFLGGFFGSACSHAPTDSEPAHIRLKNKTDVSTGLSLCQQVETLEAMKECLEDFDEDIDETMMYPAIKKQISSFEYRQIPSKPLAAGVPSFFLQSVSQGIEVLRWELSHYRSWKLESENLQYGTPSQCRQYVFALDELLAYFKELTENYVGLDVSTINVQLKKLQKLEQQVVNQSQLRPYCIDVKRLDLLRKQEVPHV